MSMLYLSIKGLRKQPILLPLAINQERMTSFGFYQSKDSLKERMATKQRKVISQVLMMDSSLLAMIGLYTKTTVPT